MAISAFYHDEIWIKLDSTHRSFPPAVGRLAINCSLRGRSFERCETSHPLVCCRYCCVRESEHLGAPTPGVKKNKSAFRSCCEHPLGELRSLGNAWSKNPRGSGMSRSPKIIRWCGRIATLYYDIDLLHFRFTKYSDVRGVERIPCVLQSKGHLHEFVQTAMGRKLNLHTGWRNPSPLRGRLSW